MGKILCALSAKTIKRNCLPRKLLKWEMNFAFEHFISTKTAETRFLNGVSADYKVAGCDYELIKNT